MGAMRMPFFAKPGGQNSVLDYYLSFELSLLGWSLNKAPFPNPGAAPGGTGIYINRGLGPDSNFPKPSLISWPLGSQPDNPTLAALNNKVKVYANNFSIATAMYYAQNDNSWSDCWSKMVNYYNPLTFNDLVLAPAFNSQQITAKLKDLSKFDGNLGGFGMSPKEADLLYTIGVGDGSWGAFYSIAALWFMRCTLFGFSTNLQTIESLKFRPEDIQIDTGETKMPYPLFEGIQSLVEYLYYVKAPGAVMPLNQAAPLFLKRRIEKISKIPSGINLTDTNQQRYDFDFVILTSTQWSVQTSIQFEGFSLDELPQNKLTTQNTQHNISSCKVFFPLKEKYWTLKGNLIPQVIITDTFIQDIYGLNWTSKAADKGVVLASYTWEDDSLKLLPFSDDNTLAEKVLTELSRITMSTVGQDIRNHIDSSKPVTIQWIQKPDYVGCAKLYRSENESGNMLDLSYNQNYAAKSKLYFAGENYGVEGGWTEPALRSAMDCVLQMLNNIGATFLAPGFNFKTDYPKWPKTK